MTAAFVGFGVLGLINIASWAVDIAISRRMLLENGNGINTGIFQIGLRANGRIVYVPCVDEMQTHWHSMFIKAGDHIRNFLTLYQRITWTTSNYKIFLFRCTERRLVITEILISPNLWHLAVANNCPTARRFHFDSRSPVKPPIGSREFFNHTRVDIDYEAIDNEGFLVLRLRAPAALVHGVLYRLEFTRN